MEDELKCAYCNDFYCNPVLLPCFHSLCYACALHLQEKFTNTTSQTQQTPTQHGKYQTSSYSRHHHANQQSIDNISTAIVNAAKSASNMIATLNSTSPTCSSSSSSSSNSSGSPHNSLLSSSGDLTSNHHHQNRALSVTDFGSSIVSDLDKLSVFSENDSGLGGLSTTTLTALINTSGGVNGFGSHHHHHNQHSGGGGGSLNQNSSCSSNNSSRPSSSYISHGSSSGLSPTDFTGRHNKKPSPSASSASLPLPPPPPLPACSLYSSYLPCPKCSLMIYMNDLGVDSLSKNTCLENIVERYTEARKLTLKCQMCPPASLTVSSENCNNSSRAAGVKEKDAVFMCEQCEIYYCEECKDAFHPMRGPLSKHELVSPKVGRDLVRRKNRSKESKCAEHASENANYYCLLCKCSCCNLCVTEDSTHLNHQIQPINGFCKSQKAELSRILQCLSEKAKSTTEYVSKLKTLPEHIEETSSQFKNVLVSEIDEMIRLLELKKKELVDFIDTENRTRAKSIKDQVGYLSSKIQKTTGLLQFCVETLKEPDAASFLQLSEHLINRMSDIEARFPPVDIDYTQTDLGFDFMLGGEQLVKEIKKLHYKQVKVPTAPCFTAEECRSDTTATAPVIYLSWQAKAASQLGQSKSVASINTVANNSNSLQGYILEIDDGTFDGQFKQVYCGSDTKCQVTGLVSNCCYNARVKAFNQAGCSEYSHIISIPASPTLWFSFNPKTSHSDLVLSNNYMSATCVSFEDRVVLGSVGFTKGVHYWEVTVDRYDNQPDPSFGVARYDVAKDHMLGKDQKSWSMYIDSKRSWFIHNGKHLNRIDNNGGIQQGSIIGVLLDLNNGTLSYFINDETHGGGIAFSKLPKGVYYPAFSLNKNVQITLSSGLEPPPFVLDNSDSD